MPYVLNENQDYVSLVNKWCWHGHTTEVPWYGKASRTEIIYKAQFNQLKKRQQLATALMESG